MSVQPNGLAVNYSLAIDIRDTESLPFQESTIAFTFEVAWLNLARVAVLMMGPVICSIANAIEVL